MEANLSVGHELFWFDRKFLDAYAELNHGAAFVTQTHLKPAFDLLSGYSISRDTLSNVVREYRASIRDLTTRELDVYGVQVADAERADPWRHCPACAMVASHADEDATEDEDGAVLCHMVDSETLGSESSEHATGIKQMLRDAGNHLGRVIHSVAFDAVAKSVRLTLDSATGGTRPLSMRSIKRWMSPIITREFESCPVHISLILANRSRTSSMNLSTSGDTYGAMGLPARCERS
jgi:hypothetical protein